MSSDADLIFLTFPRAEDLSVFAEVELSVLPLSEEAARFLDASETVTLRLIQGQKVGVTHVRVEFDLRSICFDLNKTTGVYRCFYMVDNEGKSNNEIINAREENSLGGILSAGRRLADRLIERTGSF